MTMNGSDKSAQTSESHRSPRAEGRSWLAEIVPSETPPRIALAALVAVNLLPLIGVAFWDWDVGAIVVLYWSENLILGAITIVKMLVKAPVGGFFQSLFFSLHYGGFCAVHGLFLLSLMLGVEDDPMDDAGSFGPLVFFDLLIGVVRLVLANAPAQWLWVFAGLALSHGISLLFNYFGRGEHQRVSLSDLMTAPYKRIVILHVAIIFGGMGIQALGEPVALLLVLVLLKVVMDVVLHRREHRQLQQGQAVESAN